MCHARIRGVKPSTFQDGKIDSNEENLKQLWSKIATNEIDFSHKNQLWGALFLDPEKRNKDFPGMENYVHVPTGTNLDAGTYDSKTGWVRFGSKHNDIYPRIGDLIRYHLDFEPRKSVSRAINKAEEAK
ncbi:MAG: hypothetical protein VX225_06325 [Pseudomonadota bacterium]|nr:hypothetical protein [Pseudomonadota bacterium]